MDPVLNHLLFLRSRPGPMLGSTSITVLGQYIGGYQMRLFETEPGYRTPLHDFRRWLDNRIQIGGALGWHNGILQHVYQRNNYCGLSEDLPKETRARLEEEAFHLFYELLDAFMEQEGIELANDSPRVPQLTTNN